MNKLVYTKEVTYGFNYNGDVYYEYHFADNYLNRRFRVNNGDINNNRAVPLDFKGTGSKDLSLEAVLVAERVISENADTGEKSADLLYLLPDVNQYMKVEYKKELFDQEYNTFWSVQYL